MKYSTENYGLLNALRIKNRNPNIKGSFDAKFNPRTGDHTLTLTFRGEVEKLYTGGDKDCISYLKAYPHSRNWSNK